MQSYTEHIEKSREKDILLTNSEVASRLRISERHWRRIRKMAPLTVVYIGTSPRYYWNEIKAAADGGMFDTTQTGSQSPKTQAVTASALRSA